MDNAKETVSIDGREIPIERHTAEGGGVFVMPVCEMEEFFPGISKICASSNGVSLGQMGAMAVLIARNGDNAAIVALDPVIALLMAKQLATISVAAMQQQGGARNADTGN